MPPSKVLHVIPSVSPLRGGPSTMVRRLAAGLAQAGVETHVATTDDHGPGRLDVPHGQPVGQEGATYWYFPRQARFYTVSWPLGLWLSRHVHDFDLVHIHALFSFATLPASFWAARAGVPYIVRPLGTLNAWGMTNRRPWLKRASFHLIERRVLAHTSLVHYTSDEERREAEALGVSAPSVVVPNPLAEPGAEAPAVAGAFRRRYRELGDRRIVLFLSRLDPKKGLDLLLQAFADLRRELPDVALVVAGDGDPAFVYAMTFAARTLGLERDIVWTGHLSGDEKRAAFADASLYVLPSYSENFGIAVAEALAAGLPVVVSDRVGICHDIREADAGLVVGCDVGELTSAMTRLLGDKALATTLGENGRQLAERQYSQDAVVRAMLATYDRVLSDPRIDVAERAHEAHLRPKRPAEAEVRGGAH